MREIRPLNIRSVLMPSLRNLRIVHKDETFLYSIVHTNFMSLLCKICGPSLKICVLERQCIGIGFTPLTTIIVEEITLVLQHSVLH